MLTNKNKKGFTIVEIIVVLVVLAIFAAITIPSMLGFVNRSREMKTYSEIRTISVAIESAYAEIYSKYEINENTQILYIQDMPSSEQIDKDFLAIVRSLISNDIDFDNIKKMQIVGKKFAMVYEKNDVSYTYVKLNGEVTITKNNNYSGVDTNN